MSMIRFMPLLATVVALLLSIQPTNARETPLLLRAEEGARMLNISRSKFFALMAAGHLPGVVRIGRSVRISREALERWVREQVDEREDNSAHVA